MQRTNIRIVTWAFLLALALALPSLLLQSGSASAQPVPTPTDFIIQGQDDLLPANPFPEASWQAEEAHAVLAALARGENPQGDLLAPATLVDEAQLQAAPAASTRILLPRVVRGGTAAPPTVTPTPKPNPDPDKPGADVGVGIWPNPSVQVARGSSIAYEIRASNFGAGSATNVRVRLPYNKGQMELYGSTIPGSGDWVSDITDREVTFTFGKLGKGEQRKATLFFRLKSGVAVGSTLPMQASYGWSDDDDGGTGTSNPAPVKVGTSDERSTWALFAVSPATVKANALQKFSTDRYAPGEGISFWLNLPDGGVRALNETAIADSKGAMSIELRFRDLPPGNYSLVGQGRRSGVVAVGFFTVTR